MTPDDVVQLFREKAEALDKNQITQNDAILQLAGLLADTEEWLPKQSFNALIDVGAVMFRDGLSRFRATSEVADTMDRSHRESEQKM
jgi:hypothetical protein